MWDWLKPWLTPAPVEDLRREPSSSPAGRYVRSFLYLRLMIGGLGVLLPIALLTLDKLAFDGHPGKRFPRGSISAYYYSGFREVFTVTIGTIAFFLFAYKITEKNLDNLCSMIAGLAGMAIPLFPTGRPSDADIVPKPKLTPIQHGLHENTTQALHFIASGVFIGTLAIVCVLFGIREGHRREHPTLIGHRNWRRFHFLCATLIVLAGLWILATALKVSGHGPIYKGPYWSTLLGEWVSATAFGASWFAKGAEWRYLFGHRGGPPGGSAPVPGAP
jgi:hypothetical protein